MNNIGHTDSCGRGTAGDGTASLWCRDGRRDERARPLDPELHGSLQRKHCRLLGARRRRRGALGCDGVGDYAEVGKLTGVASRSGLV